MNPIKTSPILFRYMIFHLALRVLAAIAALVVIVAIIDTAELYRRLAGRDDISEIILLSMIAAKIPATLPQLVPFGVLVGCIVSYQKMRQSHEIIVARTAGLSQFRLAIPGIVFAFLLAMVMLVVVDPVASVTAQRYAALETQTFGGGGRRLAVSTEGIWLRDQGEKAAIIIHGDSIDVGQSSITGPEVYRFDSGVTQITDRYYPEVAQLKDGYWEFRGGTRMNADGLLSQLGQVRIETGLTRRDLGNSNKPPETVPLLELWNYIKVLQSTGLPTLGHASYLYAQLALPLVLIGMVLIVARLTLGFNTRRKWTHLVAMSLLGGLAFYFIKDFLFVMGTSGRLPPLVAGFAPGVIMVCLGVILLMRADEN